MNDNLWWIHLLDLPKNLTLAFQIKQTARVLQLLRFAFVVFHMVSSSVSMKKHAAYLHSRLTVLPDLGFS